MVAREHMDQVVEMAEQITERPQVGDPSTSATHLGPLMNQRRPRRWPPRPAERRRRGLPGQYDLGSPSTLALM